MRMPREIKIAPRKTFEQILEYAVIPTFDLIIEFRGKGIILVKRKIAPYENQWALPGLRMFKPESIDETLKRIAMQELSLKIDAKNKKFIGQFVGRFKTEHERQDLSTCYLVTALGKQEIKLNAGHFSAMCFIKSEKQVPKGTGAMYGFFLKNYFAQKKG